VTNAGRLFRHLNDRCEVGNALQVVRIKPASPTSSLSCPESDASENLLRISPWVDLIRWLAEQSIPPTAQPFSEESLNFQELTRVEWAQGEAVPRTPFDGLH